MFVSQDYSQDIALGSPRENQQMYLSRATCALHGTIIYYLSNKYYLYSGGDFTGHPPEVPFYALARAQTFIEDKFKVKIKKIYRRTDKGSYKWVKTTRKCIIMSCDIYCITCIASLLLYLSRTI